MASTITDEQFAARELVRDWAVGSGATEAVRDIEQGEPKAWQSVFEGLAGLGLFGVAVPEDCGGAGGSIEDLSAMVEEAARALVPGPVATTALATLVVSDPTLLEALASGERTAGVAFDSDVEFDEGTSQVSGTVPWVLGGIADGLLLVPAGETWLLIDATADGVAVEPLQAADFSRPLARAVLTSAPAIVIDAPTGWVTDLTVTVLSPKRRGSPAGRWTPPSPMRRCVSSSANRSAASRRSSTCAPKCFVAQSRWRWLPPTPLAPPTTVTLVSSPLPRPSPPASRSKPSRPTPRTASRCSAVSGSPGNTTRICICAGPMESDSSSVGPPAGCAEPPS